MTEPLDTAPLGDVRVLDLSEGIAGPFCTKLLAALGADVISVEAPGRGDRARSYAPFPDDDPHPELSGLFLYLNTGKRSVTLDLEQASGRALCKRLAGWADVVIEDFAPGRLDAWGLGYEALDATRAATIGEARPGVIVVSVADFGQSGPYRDWQATDLTALALGGSLYIAGDEDREPLKIGGRPAQFFAGLSAFSGALIALHHRDATSEGQHVDVSMHEGIATAQEYPGAAWAYKREIRPRGNSARADVRGGRRLDRADVSAGPLARLLRADRTAGYRARSALQRRAAAPRPYGRAARDRRRAGPRASARRTSTTRRRRCRRRPATSAPRPT